MEYEGARLDLARLNLEGGASLDAALSEVARVCAHTVEVERVGIWAIDRDTQLWSCLRSYERSTGTFTSGATLDASAYPNYTKALYERRLIDADDARTHPFTRELRDDYLVPMDVSSMLDAPVYRGGRVVGIVCHEHTGPMRQWTARERDFAVSVAEVLAALFEQAARLEVESLLRRKERELVQRDRMEALGRMAAGVAHDFNNVLGAVSLQAQQLALTSEDPRRLARAGAIIREATEHGARLTRQLLAFARQQPTAPQPMQLGAVFHGTDAMLRALVRAKATLELRVETDNDAVYADPVQMEQLLINLVTNARDAIESKGHIVVVVRDARMDEARDPSAFVVLEVSDDGVGMSDEIKERIFEPFFTTKGDARGTGLGLATVYGIVEQSGGALHVESEQGRGSRFVVALPRRRESP